MFHSKADRWPLPTSRTRLERLARDKHSSLLRKFVNYEPDKFHNIGPRVQSYKTFYVHDLRIFCNRLECFFTGWPFQPSIMLVGNTRSG
jgi:hypothetical protein